MKKLNSFYFILVLVFATCFGFASCSDDDESVNPNPNPNPPTGDSITQNKKPKYIFLFIGDGMSTAQVSLTEAALGSSSFSPKQSSLKNNSFHGKLNLKDFPVTGMQTTSSSNSYITDSGAAATAMATGKKTGSGIISKSEDLTKEYTTIAEMAKDKGMKVGIVSSVSIDHATPAAFYAHNDSRSNYQEIGQDLLDSKFDYFAGGNVRFNKYKNYSLQDFIGDLNGRGYSYVSSRAEFDALNAETEGKVFATLNYLNSYTRDGSAMPYTIDLDEQKEDDQITLDEFTQKGIEMLDNEKGFFMMVEGGKIDWACHANDGVTAAMEMYAFDAAIGKALEFYKKHEQETLIIVTGDHECGGLTLGYAGTSYSSAFKILDKQTESFFTFRGRVKEWKKSQISFEQAMDTAQLVFGFNSEDILMLTDYEEQRLKKAFAQSMAKNPIKDDETAIIYGSYDPFTVTLTHILNNKAGVAWTSYAHTGSPVPVFAIGQGMSHFSGYYDNTDIGKKIMEIADLESNE